MVKVTVTSCLSHSCEQNMSGTSLDKNQKMSLDRHLCNVQRHWFGDTVAVVWALTPIHTHFYSGDTSCHVWSNLGSECFSQGSMWTGIQLLTPGLVDNLLFKYLQDRKEFPKPIFGLHVWTGPRFMVIDQQGLRDFFLVYLHNCITLYAHLFVWSSLQWSHMVTQHHIRKYSICINLPCLL